MINRYSYERLLAEAGNGVAGAVDNLAEWFLSFGSCYWNGECYDIDGSRSLYPIEEENTDGDIQVIGWEIR